MNQTFNPFLPLNEYVPDGEPHVFGDRIYLFGSHDKEAGDTFCMLDYCVYSAPVTDLADWRFDGIIYRSSQDPNNDGKRIYMYAPDVVQGNDGRYYLYYSLAGYRGKQGFDGPISVAVCETPAGQYEYYGDVKYPDGRKLLRMIPFDPAVINDEGKIRLYYGWSLPFDKPKSRLASMIINKVMQNMFSKTKAEIQSEPEGIMGANTVLLEDDMITVASEVHRIVPGKIASDGTSFAEHAFFEASSIRKIGSTYYFIYSSHLMHELCYATSPYPDRDFVYKGIIVSAGDVGFKARLEKDRLNATGNNHGSIECIKGQWYVFYHRHTHNTNYSRQACAERIEIKEDGSIPQVEITSCGLNGKALPAEGEYPAVIACNLTDGRMKHVGNGKYPAGKPYFTSGNGRQFITNIGNNVLTGYKYFAFDKPVTLTVTTRGKGRGRFLIMLQIGGKPITEIGIAPSRDWTSSSVVIEFRGETPLYFLYKGTGKIDFVTFGFYPA